jgi:hypothetical protein
MPDTSSRPVGCSGLAFREPRARPVTRIVSHSETVPALIDGQLAPALLQIEPGLDLDTLVLTVLRVLDVGQDQRLPDIADKIEVDAGGHQFSQDFEVVAVEVLDLINMDLVVDAAQPVEDAARTGVMGIESQLREMPLVGPAIVVQEPTFTGGESAGITIEAEAAEAPAGPLHREVRAHPVPKEEAEPALDFDVGGERPVLG